MLFHHMDQLTRISFGISHIANKVRHSMPMRRFKNQAGESSLILQLFLLLLVITEIILYNSLFEINLCDFRDSNIFLRLRRN